MAEKSSQKGQKPDCLHNECHSKEKNWSEICDVCEPKVNEAECNLKILQSLIMPDFSQDRSYTRCVCSALMYQLRLLPRSHIVLKARSLIRIHFKDTVKIITVNQL